MSTFEQAEAAKKKLSKQLMGSFNGAASPVNGIGVGRDQDGFHIAVRLERRPTAAEAAQLPEKYDGVSVKYSVIGPIYAL
jgi:autonomous glycyl radical cofactor GrcA